MAAKKKEIQKQNQNLRRILVGLVGMQVAILLVTLLKIQNHNVTKVVEDQDSSFPFWVIIWTPIFVSIFATRNKKVTPEGMRVKYIALVAIGLLVLLVMLSFLLFR